MSFSRYDLDKIYTRVGDILVSINPFKMLPIYDELTQKQYIRAERGSVAPHIYATADEAYSGLVLSGESQCCIVSGETGAGKTECAKAVMRQLMSLCSERRAPAVAKKPSMKVCCLSHAIMIIARLRTVASEEMAMRPSYRCDFVS